MTEKYEAFPVSERHKEQFKALLLALREVPDDVGLMSVRVNGEPTSAIIIKVPDEESIRIFPLALLLWDSIELTTDTGEAPTENPGYMGDDTND